MSENKNFPKGWDLWQQVCTTDPTHTKKVSYGRKFTAIDSQYQIQEATKIWGSYGSGWGVRECNYEYIRNGKGEILELILEAVFFYPDGAFQISADCQYKTGNDCRKKILTDLTTKALSKLGFNADVFMGKFDDNKYLSAVKEMYSKPQNPASVKGAGIRRRKVGEVAFDKLVKRIQAGEEGLAEKAFAQFDLTNQQTQVLQTYGATEN